MTGSRDDDIRIIQTRFGPKHAFPDGKGSYTLCARKPELCRECAANGVPVEPPDPFDVAHGLIQKYWDHRWFDNYRARTEEDDRHFRMDQGVYIYVVVDGETTVIANFGDDESIRRVVSAIVWEHNIRGEFE